MSEYTHIKKMLNPNFMGEWSLPGGNDVVLTIGGFGEREGWSKEDNKKEVFPVILWVEDYEWAKPMIPNATNVDAIIQATGTTAQEEMIGKMVQVGAKEGTWFGKKQKAIRIRPIKSSELLAKYNEFLKGIPECKTREDINALMTQYAVYKPFSKDVQKQIKDKWQALTPAPSPTSDEAKKKSNT